MAEWTKSTERSVRPVGERLGSTKLSSAWRPRTAAIRVAASAEPLRPLSRRYTNVDDISARRASSATDQPRAIAGISNLQPEASPDACDSGGHRGRRAAGSLSWRHSNRIQRSTAYLAVSRTFTGVRHRERVVFRTGLEFGSEKVLCRAQGRHACRSAPHLIEIRRWRAEEYAGPRAGRGVRLDSSTAGAASAESRGDPRVRAPIPVSRPSSSGTMKVVHPEPASRRL